MSEISKIYFWLILFNFYLLVKHFFTLLVLNLRLRSNLFLKVLDNFLLLILKLLIIKQPNTFIMRYREAKLLEMKARQVFVWSK